MKNKKIKEKINEISKNITFNELLEKYPESAEVLFKKGMHCIGCAISAEETLEQGAMAHGLDVNELIKEINKKLKK